MVGGIWGTIAVGLFGDPKILGTGLLGGEPGVFDISNGLFWPLDAERFPQLRRESALEFG